jgi:hypothetical protein
MNILPDLIQTNKDFLYTLNSFTEQQVFFSQEGKWNAAQIVEHVILSDKAVARWLTSSTKSTTRSIDKNIPSLKSLFQNFDIEMKSPTFILPQGTLKNKHEVISAFTEEAQAMEHLISTLDLTETCLEIQEPAFKDYTRFELVYFAIVHTQRHLHQLQKLHALA